MTTTIHETDDFTIEDTGTSTCWLAPRNPKARAALETAIRETIQVPELLDTQQADGAVYVCHPLTLADTLDAAADILKAQREAEAA